MPKHVKDSRLGKRVHNIRGSGHFVRILLRVAGEHSWTTSGSSGMRTSTNSTTTYCQRFRNWFKASEGHMEVPKKLVLDEYLPAFPPTT